MGHHREGRHLGSDMSRRPGRLAGGRQHTVVWFIVIGDVVGEAILGWPAVEVCEGGKVQSLCLDPQGEPDMLLVYDHAIWDAVGYQWVSPWGMQARGALRPRELKSSPSIVAWVDARPGNLLEVAASHAFWGATDVGLGWYCRYPGVSAKKNPGLIGKLEVLIAHLLPDISKEEVLELMLPRARMPAFYDDILMADDANDLIDDKDQAEFEKTKG